MDASPFDSTTADQDLEVVLSAERMDVHLVRTAVQTVRVSRRIVTETIQVPVTIRREEIALTQTPVSGSPEGQAAREPVEDLVLVLHEEVPVVSLQVRATERVKVGVQVVAGELLVSADLRHEVIQLDTHGVQPDRS